VLCGGPDGTFYYYSLDYSLHCDMFRSADGGLSWTDPVSAYGGDKYWMTVDQTGGLGSGNIYMTWSGAQDFTRSVDGGLT
jgi:hypothetical protein